MPRFRFVRQRDAMQCGVACLTMVCRILGRQVSLETVAAIILLLAILASALPYPPEPSQSIMRHLLGF